MWASGEEGRIYCAQAPSLRTVPLPTAPLTPLVVLLSLSAPAAALNREPSVWQWDVIQWEMFRLRR